MRGQLERGRDKYGPVEEFTIVENGVRIEAVAGDTEPVYRWVDGIKN